MAEHYTHGDAAIVTTAEWRDDLASNSYWNDKPTARASMLMVLDELDAAQRRCEVYAAGVIGIATYQGEWGLGYETPKRMAVQTLERIERLSENGRSTDV